MYDAVVVGAGPAGAMVARTMAEMGAEVLIVEKRQEIGVPVRCGEATGIAGLKELHVKVDKKFVKNQTRGAYIYSPDRFRVELLSEKPIGYILDRRLFDKSLILQAVKAGAEVRVGTSATGIVRENGRVAGVEVKTGGKKSTIRCSCVVGADGVESNVGRWAGLPTRTKVREMIACAEFELTGVELESHDILEFYFGSKTAPGGYAWVFPKGENIANVGLGIRNAEEGESAISYLKKFVQANQNLRRGKITRIVVGGVPVQGPVDKSVAQGVILVGDAARQVDPLTGGGIYNAMHCGALAGKVLAKAAERLDFSEEALWEYEEMWRREIGDTLIKSLHLRKILDAMSDDDLNAAARLLGRVNIDDLQPAEGILHQGMSLDIVGFLQRLLLKN